MNTARILWGGLGFASALAMIIGALWWASEADLRAQISTDLVEQSPGTVLGEEQLPLTDSATQGVQMAQLPTDNQPAWRLRCADPNDVRSCNINQELFLNQVVDGQNQNMGRLLNITVVYLDVGGDRRPFMSLQMPLGVDLRPGAVVRVDEGQEYALQYLRCTNAGCDASIDLTGDLLDAMRAGISLFVGFRPWGTEQVTVVPASLIGFTAAFNQLR